MISKEGIQTSRRKIEAIKNVKPPNDQTELRSFLVMVNHYGKLIRCLADPKQPPEIGCSMDLVERVPGKF